MNVLLIGGAGYLGHALTKRFIETNFRITIVDKMLHGNYETVVEHENVRFIDDDILNIEKHINDIQDFERIIYLASPRLNDVTSENIEIELNTLKKTIDILKKYINNECIFWFMSSCSVYGKTTQKVNEETEPIVTSKYSELKIKSEHIIQEENENFRILRLSTLYGKSEFQRNDILINQLIDDIKHKRKIELWDPDANRPHIHIQDAAEMIRHVLALGQSVKEKVLNIGVDDFNISKKEILEKIKNTLDIEVDAEYLVVNDSRDYLVDFSKYKTRYIEDENEGWIANWERNLVSYEEGIFDLFVDVINLSHEEYDSILGCYRPNGSSKTWYLEEEGHISIPKMWGSWNVIDDATNSIMNVQTFKLQTFPAFRRENIKYLSKQEVKNQNHIYLISIYNPAFFQLNEKIGFKCISPKFIEDVKRNRAKIVMYHTLEGYSGETGNNDLEIIQSWIDELNIPSKNVYYLHGNLKVGEISKEKGIQFNCIGVSSFDLWLNPLTMPDEPCGFHPHESKYLYLSYNRNVRAHRITLVCNLIQSNLLEDGMVSVGDFDYDEYVREHKWFYPKDHGPIIQQLKEMVPIEIDKTLDTNWANDISMENFRNTFVSVVTETHYDENIMFLSEKIWKPIYVGHPFIVLGNPGMLKFLKSMGYKTFDKWWDESYDNDLDVRVRAKKITKILTQLKDKPLDELRVFRDEMDEILKHNQELYRTQVKKRYSLNRHYYQSELPILKLISNIYYGFL